MYFVWELDNFCKVYYNRSMEISEILRKCDHTLLDRCATENDIEALIDDGIKYKVATVCIPPCYVRFAKDYSAGRIPICTVVGFPNGYNNTTVKAFEAKTAISDGADEIDAVINVGMVKAAKYMDILYEIRRLREICGKRILKIIIETCLLTDDEKKIMCKIVSEGKADFIKTSTGFAAGGATREDIALLKANVSLGVGVKAAGGIKTLKDAEDLILLGADRLGTSRIVNAVKQAEEGKK